LIIDFGGFGFMDNTYAELMSIYHELQLARDMRYPSYSDP
jgi:hypothetical protein